MQTGEPAKIVEVSQRMRGGSQSFLVRASDGWAYVAKFSGNPQGNRTLINECVASYLLSALNIATPDLKILNLTDSCMGRDELYFSTNRREPIVNGLHLGSKCPVDPDAVAIFDFLPRNMYSRVENIRDAGTVFAFDCWVAHTDTRQFVFARNKSHERESASKCGGKISLTAWAIDNGMCFGGDWNLTELVLPASHRAVEIYSHCNLEESALAGAKLIQDFPATVIQSSHQQIPRDWFSHGDEEALAAMLRTLQDRRQTLVATVEEQVLAVKYRARLAS